MLQFRPNKLSKMNCTCTDDSESEYGSADSSGVEDDSTGVTAEPQGYITSNTNLLIVEFISNLS